MEPRFHHLAGGIDTKIIPDSAPKIQCLSEPMTPIFHLKKSFCRQYHFDIKAKYEMYFSYSLLSSGRSSFIAGKIREVLRSRLDSGPLTSDKIRKLIQSPQVAALCCLHQFFNTAEGGKPFTQEELKDQVFRKWLSQSGPAGKSTLSVFYQIWNTSDQNFNPVELSMALGAGLVADIFSPEECIAKFNFYRDSHHHARCYPQAET